MLPGTSRKIGASGKLVWLGLLPDAVFRECLHKGAPEALRRALEPLPHFLHVAHVNALLPETAVLDDGEAAAITLAWQNRSNSLLLIDEKRGRAIASSLGLHIRGILGIVAEAHRRQVVDFDSTMADLREHGFRISEALMHQVRCQLGIELVT